MPRGGWRNGGRPKGSLDSKPRKPRKGSKAYIEYEEIQKALARSMKVKKKRVASVPVGLVDDKIKDGEKDKSGGVQIENLDPLDYMRKVWNDPNEKDIARKDRLAMAAMPYVHLKPGEGVGKKEQKEEKAKSAVQGKFAPSKQPISLVK